MIWNSIMLGFDASAWWLLPELLPTHSLHWVASLGISPKHSPSFLPLRYKAARPTWSTAVLEVLFFFFFKQQQVIMELFFFMGAYFKTKQHWHPVLICWEGKEQRKRTNQHFTQLRFVCFTCSSQTETVAKNVGPGDSAIPLLSAG